MLASLFWNTVYMHASFQLACMEYSSGGFEVLWKKSWRGAAVPEHRELSKWNWPGHRQRSSSASSSKVASLGLVSPKAAADTVSPLFFLKKLATFLVITVCQLSVLSPSPWRVSPRTFFYLSDLICPLFFVNSATKIFVPSGVSVTPRGCHPGRSVPLSTIVTQRTAHHLYFRPLAHSIHTIQSDRQLKHITLKVQIKLD